jgi:hypothetical protein
MSFQVRDDNGHVIPQIFDIGATQVLTVTTSSVQSTAFGAETRFVRVAVSNGHCHVKIGSNPTASITTSAIVPNNWVEVFPCDPGDKIAVIKDAAVALSTISVTELV